VATPKNLLERIADLEKPALLVLIAKLLQQNPNLHKTLELALAQPASPAKAKPQTQVSEAMYRKLVKSILRQQGHEHHPYGDYGKPEYVSELENVIKTAVESQESNDPEGAIIILRVLLEETTDDYDSEMDYNGDLACVLQDIGMPLAEAILSADLDAQFRYSLQAAIQEIYENLGENIEESELAVVLMALVYGWDEIPENQEEEYDEEDEYNEDEEDSEDEEPDWMDEQALQTARLNVLERQNRTDDFLQLAEHADPRRHTLKLLQLGRTDEAISASQYLGYASEIIELAKYLYEIGRMGEAIALAERGLSTIKDYALAVWLAPFGEAQGNTEMAIRAYRIAFDAHPAIAHYRKLKQLAGPAWETLRPELVEKAGEGYDRDTLADICLEEQEWDAAIALTGQNTWSTSLLEKLADKLISHRPDWVILVSLKQSNALIAETVSKRYPYAAQWLARAKKAYEAKGQIAE